MNDLNTKLQETEKEFDKERNALKCQSADISRKMEVCICLYNVGVYVSTGMCMCIGVYLTCTCKHGMHA